MSRRFQFSLRVLLIAVTAVGFGLGLWCWINRYGDYVESAPARVGKPIKIRGRFVQLASSRQGYYEFGALGFAGTEVCLLQSGTDFTTKTWFLGYYFERDLGPVDRPCEVDFLITPKGRRDIRGKVTVLPAQD